MSLDSEGNLWGQLPLGSLRRARRPDGGDPALVSLSGGGYGGFFDPSGILWSSDPSLGQLVRYDPTTGSAQYIPILLSSGLAEDAHGNVWNSMWTRNTIARVEPQGAIADGFPMPTFGGGSFGVAVAADGDVWIANSATHTVTRLSPEGSLRKRLTVGTSPNGVGRQLRERLRLARRDR